MHNFLIERLSALADLGHNDVDELVAVTSRSRRSAARRDVVCEGDPPGPLIVILEGWACRYTILPNGMRQVLGFLLPGDMSDLHAHHLDEMDHAIQTITPSRVATIDRGQIDGLLSRRGSIAHAMHCAGSVDDAILRSWMTSLGRRSSIERVAHLMCEFYVRARTVGLANEPCFSLPISQLMLADAVGMTPVHLNRVLRELRLTGAMSFRRGYLTIIDLPKLSGIAQFDPNYLYRRSLAEPHSLVDATIVQGSVW